MRQIKGMRDIKTHGGLAREGRLVGVARNLHRARSRGSEGGNVSDGWSAERHIYPKKLARPRMASVASLPREIFLEKQVRLYLINDARDLIQDMQQAIAEGIPVVVHELERLTKKLARLLQS